MGDSGTLARVPNVDPRVFQRKPRNAQGAARFNYSGSGPGDFAAGPSVIQHPGQGAAVGRAVQSAAKVP